MQNDGKLPAAERRNYKHAVDGFLRIWREEGATTLFRGLSANVRLRDCFVVDDEVDDDLQNSTYRSIAAW